MTKILKLYLNKKDYVASYFLFISKKEKKWVTKMALKIVCILKIH